MKKIFTMAAMALTAGFFLSAAVAGDTPVPTKQRAGKQAKQVKQRQGQKGYIGENGKQVQQVKPKQGQKGYIGENGKQVQNN